MKSVSIKSIIARIAILVAILVSFGALGGYEQEMMDTAETLKTLITCGLIMFLAINVEENENIKRSLTKEKMRQRKSNLAEERVQREEDFNEARRQFSAAYVKE